MRLPQLSVLCLHGYSQDGHVLSRQMRRVTKHLEQRARFTFIDAPFSVPSLPDPSKQGFSWWLPSRNSEGQWEFEGVDEALRTLSEADAAEKRTHGAGFDGVLGFSQGGALASLSVGLLQVQGEKGRQSDEAIPQSDEAIPQSAEAIPPPPPPLGSLRFAIFCGAFPYSAARPNFERVMRAPLSLSSVHCIGARDEIVKPAKSKQLEALFREEGRVALAHAGGHVVPSGEEALQSLDRFLEGHQRDAMADMAREFSNGSYC